MREIGKLQTHVKWIERGLIGFATCLFGLAAFGWHSYDALTGKITDLAVAQQSVGGKLDTLDAKISGKLDVIGQRLDDKSQTSARTEPAK